MAKMTKNNVACQHVISCPLSCQSTYLPHPHFMWKKIMIPIEICCIVFVCTIQNIILYYIWKVPYEMKVF